MAVFEDASPSVAFISTTILTPRGIVQAGAGSGFVWDADGHIVTNYHVVANPVARQPSQSRVMVSLQGIEGQVEATVVGHEADKDLAVLKVDPARLRPLKPLQVASSSTLRVGQDVLAIGNPFGLDYTLTTGIVSALGRDIDGYGGRPIKDCVQTDAAINPGNSGGPLLDSRGRLIGVNTMIFSPGGAGGNVGIGFAVPSDTVSRVVRQIVEFGNNARPSLGVNLLDDRAREQYARSLGRPLRGAILAEVVAGSPAEALSLAPCRRRYGSVVLGDMIVEVDGKPIGRNEDLICAIEEAEPGSAVSLKVVRNCDPERLEELRFTPVMRKTLAERR